MNNAPITPSKDELDKILLDLVDEVSSIKAGKTFTPTDYTDAAKQRIQELYVLKAEHTKVLDALYWMYIQYCSGGHDSMGAGEDASEILENAGYIEVNGAGRVTKDNGDSSEQKLNLIEE